jgi:uncharacterized protein YbjT (DUF2867 family)
MSTILITGARGTVGSTLVPLLEREGHTVRRATSQPPADQHEVHLDLTNGNGREDALRGVDALFLLAPPGHTNQDALLIPMIDAARAHHVRKIVLMTAMGADADPAAPLARVESHLASSGIAYNIIRPNWFMQNFASYWLQPILERGAIVLPVGDATVSLIDARDIAAVAARLLTSSTFDNQAFDLTGGEAVDHHQVAALIAAETGRDISYQDIAPEDFRPQLLAAGLPADYAHFLLHILGFLKAGYSARTTDAVQRITGAAPRPLAAWIHEARDTWMP